MKAAAVLVLPLLLAGCGAKAKPAAPRVVEVRPLFALSLENRPGVRGTILAVGRYEGWARFAQLTGVPRCVAVRWELRVNGVVEQATTSEPWECEPGVGSDTARLFLRLGPGTYLLAAAAFELGERIAVASREIEVR